MCSSSGYASRSSSSIKAGAHKTDDACTRTIFVNASFKEHFTGQFDQTDNRSFARLYTRRTARRFTRSRLHTFAQVRPRRIMRLNYKTVIQLRNPNRSNCVSFCYEGNIGLFNLP